MTERDAWIAVLTARVAQLEAWLRKDSRTPVTSVEARQVLDLPDVRLRVVEHRLRHRRCRCRTVTMAAIPDGVGAPVQYGPRVRAVERRPGEDGTAQRS